MRIITIVTGLPPQIDGVGDYALSLARQMRNALGIATHFVVGNPAWDGPARVEGFQVSRLANRSQRELLNLLRAETHNDSLLLLHYGGYGYATRGCPVWLVDAMRQWRTEQSKRVLMTMFHELYASGPPWSSSFWLSPLQKRLTAQLARLSDHCLTSLARYANLLSRLNGNEQPRATHLPVFSSIGEPARVTPLRARRRRLVVFGTRGRRIEVYRRTAAALQRLCRALDIEEILDIGRSVDFDIAQAVGLPVIACGETPGDEVSEMLSDAIAGVIDYPADMLAKSTIFAAYCAHGLVPIIAPHGEASPADDLLPGTHYWLTDTASATISMAAAQAIADNARAWYQAHNLAAHTQMMAAYITGNDCAVKES